MGHLTTQSIILGVARGLGTHLCDPVGGRLANIPSTCGVPDKSIFSLIVPEIWVHSRAVSTMGHWNVRATKAAGLIGQAVPEGVVCVPIGDACGHKRRDSAESRKVSYRVEAAALGSFGVHKNNVTGTRIQEISIIVRMILPKRGVIKRTSTIAIPTGFSRGRRCGGNLCGGEIIGLGISIGI